MAAVRAPWLNPASMQAEWGFHCVACRTENNKASYEWAPEFTSTSFRQHLVEFGEIRDEQHIRPAGTADS